MQVVHEVCCGLDVHKKSVTACVLWASGRGRQTREFGTFTKDLLEMKRLAAELRSHARRLEFTGVYWKPVWNLLAADGQFFVHRQRGKPNVEAGEKGDYEKPEDEGKI